MKWLTAMVALLLLIGASSCSRDPEVIKRKYVENGNKYFERGKYKEASIMYRSALKKDRLYGEAYYRLALTQLKQKQVPAAIGSLRRAVELQPENDDAKAKLADLYLAAYLADPKRSRQLYEEIKELAAALRQRNPKSFDGLRLEGYLAWMDGDLKKATELFRAADSVKPMDPDLILALCQVLEADGRFEEGEKLAKALIEKNGSFGAIYDVLYLQYMRRNRVEDAENIYRLRVEKNPNSQLFIDKLASHYYLLQRRDDAARTLQRILSNPKEFPNPRLIVGDFYLRFREFDKAIEHYTAGLESGEGKREQFKIRIADALIVAGKRAEASKVVEEILKENPKNAQAKAMHASLLLDTGTREQLQTVLSELEVSVKQMPENPVVRFNLGRAYWAKGEIEQARDQFKTALALRPDYLAPRLALAQLHINRQEWAMALQTANEALAISPTTMQTRLLRAIALRGMGNYNQGRNELAEIVRQNPTATDAQFQLGLLDLAEKKYDQAEQSFMKCNEAAPSDLRCLMGLVETYSAQNQYDRAIQLLSETGRKMPDRSEIPTALANTAVRAGRYDMAVSLLKELIAKNPKSSDLHIKLGETYRRMGNTEGAIEYFTKGKDLSPNDAIAYIPLALLLDGAGRKAQARQLYEQMLKLQPDNAVALNNLAYTIAELGGNLDQALTYAQRAKQRLPNDPNVSDTLGWIYIKKNLTGNAIDIYKELVGKYPDNPTYRYHMAMALFQKGDKPQAKKELQAALRNNPSKEEEGRIKELMAKIG